MADDDADTVHFGTGAGQAPEAAPPAPVVAEAGQATTGAESGAATTPGLPNPAPIPSGKVRLKTPWTTDRFDPDADGDMGLPVITSAGTDVDPSQVDDLKHSAAACGIELEEVTS